MLTLVRLLETAKRQKLRSNSGLSQRELLDSGIDIMETNGELYSDSKEQASRRSIEAQLYAAGLSPCLAPPPAPHHTSSCIIRRSRLIFLCCPWRVCLAFCEMDALPKAVFDLMTTENNTQ